MRDLYAGMKLRTSDEEVLQECVYPQRKPCTCLLRSRVQGLLFYENISKCLTWKAGLLFA